MRIKEDELGLLMFRLLGLLYYYMVAHFGAKFAAYWWGRLGGLLHRILHALIFVDHAGFLYADDWLWRFSRAAAPLLAAFDEGQLPRCYGGVQLDLEKGSYPPEERRTSTRALSTQAYDDVLPRRLPTGFCKS